MESKFERRCYTCLIIFVVLELVLGDYHCRRKGFSCQNGGACKSDGSCACPLSHSGFDCSIDTGLIGCDEECANGGICYDDGKCSCSPDYYGDKCQYKTVSSECLGTVIKMTFVAPQSFTGEIYVGKDERNCQFNQLEAEVQGFKKYTLTIPFDTDDACSKTVNKTEDDPAKGDVSRYVDVIVSYNPMFVSSTDKIIIYSCVHKGSNFTMFAELDDIGLDERINLKKDIHKGTYSPVRFVVLDKDGQPLEKPLFVGDIFKLLFFLADTNVYETLSIDYCIANNTMSQKPIKFEFVENGCPTDDGKNIMVNPEGPIVSQYTRPGTTLQLPASELLMYAFKFKGTTNVGFNCAVRICKKGDENFCKATDCSTPAMALETDTEDATNSTSAVISTDGISGNAVSSTDGISGNAVSSTDDISGNAVSSTDDISGNAVSSTDDISGNAVSSTDDISGNAVSITDDISGNSTNTTDIKFRRKRASNYGDRQIVSAMVTVQEPNIDGLLILPNIDRNNLRNDENSKSEQQHYRARCVISQNIIIVIVVMATMIFVLVVISTVLAITTYRKKRRIQILKNKQTFDCDYTIPRPKLNEQHC